MSPLIHQNAVASTPSSPHEVITPNSRSSFKEEVTDKDGNIYRLSPNGLIEIKLFGTKKFEPLACGTGTLIRYGNDEVEIYVHNAEHPDYYSKIHNGMEYRTKNTNDPEEYYKDRDGDWHNALHYLDEEVGYCKDTDSATSYHDPDGEEYYKNEDESIYYLDEYGYVYYKDEDKSIYYLDEYGGMYYLDEDGDICYKDEDRDIYYLDKYGSIYYLDEDGYACYKDEDRDIYYLDEYGYVCYKNEDGSIYYLDQNGYKYYEHTDGHHYYKDKNGNSYSVETNQDGTLCCTYVKDISKVKSRVVFNETTDDDMTLIHNTLNEINKTLKTQNPANKTIYVDPMTVIQLTEELQGLRNRRQTTPMTPEGLQKQKINASTDFKKFTTMLKEFPTQSKTDIVKFIKEEALQIASKAAAKAAAKAATVKEQAALGKAAIKEAALQIKLQEAEAVHLLYNKIKIICTTKMFYGNEIYTLQPLKKMANQFEQNGSINVANEVPQFVTAYNKAKTTQKNKAKNWPTVSYDNDKHEITIDNVTLSYANFPLLLQETIEEAVNKKNDSTCQPPKSSPTALEGAANNPNQYRNSIMQGRAAPPPIAGVA